MKKSALKKNASTSDAGGAAGARGYVIQALVALLDSLDTEKFGDWKYVGMELRNSDKVDIYWEMATGKLKVMQVKSSSNPFQPREVAKWAKELVDQSPKRAAHFAIRLVGPRHGRLPTTINGVSISSSNLDALSITREAAQLLDHLLFKNGKYITDPRNRENFIKAAVFDLIKRSIDNKQTSKADLVKFFLTIPSPKSLKNVAVVAKGIAKLTMSFVNTQLRHIGVKKLVAEPLPARTAESRPNLRSPAPHRGTQSSVFAHVSEILARKLGMHVTITGHAGVGKSVVMHSLARELAAGYLRDSAAPFPVLIPFNAIKVSDSTLEAIENGNSKQAMSCLMREWINWTQRNSEKHLVGEEYLLSHMACHNTVIILDGIDDLIARNSRISTSKISEAIKEFLDVAPGTVSIVISLRKTQPGIHLLAGPTEFHEIDRISEDVALSICPKIKLLLRYFDSNDAREIILSPLLFFWIVLRIDAVLRGMTTSSQALASTSRAAFMEHLLLVLLESTAICRTSRYAPTIWLDALALIAWVYHCPGSPHEGTAVRSTMTVQELKSECQAICSDWTASTNGLTRQAARDFLTGCRLATSENTLRGILNQTLFFSVGGDSFQFIHRDWHDLLVGRYFQRCLDFENIEEWGRMAHSLTISSIAGQLMGPYVARNVFVRRIIDTYHSDDTANEFMVGNYYGAVATNPFGCFDSSAIQTLLESIESYRSFTRTLIVTGTGNRILLTHNWDHCKEPFVVFLSQLLKRKSKLDPVSLSAAWCFLKVMSPSNATGLKWQDFTASPDYERKLSGVVCDIKNNGASVSARQRSLQIPIGELLRSVYLSPLRCIAVAHYLCLLTLAAKYGALTAEVYPHVVDALKPGSQLERAIERNFPTIRRNLKMILHHCRKQWEHTGKRVQ